jgi:hypothetical protein
MDEVHGDHQKAHIHPIESDIKLVNPQDIIQKVKLKDTINYIFDIRLIQLLGEPAYQIFYSNEHDRGKKVQLAHAVSGELTLSINKKRSH